MSLCVWGCPPRFGIVSSNLDDRRRYHANPEIMRTHRPDRGRICHTVARTARTLLHPGSAAGDGMWCYLAEYGPWSRPTLFDTRTPSRSNEGHGFYDLDDRQKLSVLEYMKTL